MFDHVGLKVRDLRVGTEFYRAALPGVRADYSADYYAAFVIDPDGHNIEVVCFA